MTVSDLYLYIVIAVFSVFIAVLGYKRNIGSIYAFLLSVTLTPLVGLIITLCTNTYSKKPPKKSYAVRVTGIFLLIIGLVITVIAFITLMESLEIYKHYDKGPMYAMIKLGLGLALLGLFNIENGSGKSFAYIPENKEKDEEANFAKNKDIVVETNVIEKDSNKKIEIDNKGITFILLLSLSLVVLYVYRNSYNSNNKIVHESINSSNVEITSRNELSRYYINQMINNETQTYRATGHRKAYNGDWQFKIPNSFNIYEGDQPHVLIKMGNANNPYVAMVVSGHNLNYDFNENDVEAFFSNSTLMSEIISGKGISIQEKQITIDGNPGFMAETEYRYTHIDHEIKIRGLSFFFINNKCLFNLTCSVTTDDMSENLSYKMNEYREFFKIVAGTIIVNKNY